MSLKMQMNKIEIMNFQVITSSHNIVKDQPRPQTVQELPQHDFILVTTQHVIDFLLVFTRLSRGGLQNEYLTQILLITDVKLIQ